MSKNSNILIMAGILSEAEYNFHMELPDGIFQIYNAFKKYGKQIFVVGGAVRDAYKGKTPKDYDLATDVHDKDVEKILSAENIYNFPSGKAFGIISAVIDKVQYEIATFRKEDYTNSDGRRPTWVGFSDMQNDVMRRDLTINALYYDIDNKKIIDLVGGIEDLKIGRIRPVGKAMERFTEDRLRVLRALRFAHHYGTSLEKETVDAMLHFKDLPGVSNERISEEFIKGIKTSIKPELYLKDFISMGFGKRVFGNVELNTNFVPGLRNPLLILAKMLGPNTDAQVAESLTNFKIGNHEKIDAILFLRFIRQKFHEFDKLVFDPQVDSRWFEQFIKKKNLVLEQKEISVQDVKQWAELMSLDLNIIDKVMAFNFVYSAKNFPEIKPGQELGQKIAMANAKHFLDNL